MRLGHNQEALRRAHHELLPQQGRPAALDEPQLAVHLVGAVDRDVQHPLTVQLDGVEAKPAAELRRPLRGERRANRRPLRPALPRELHRAPHGAPGAQADGHPGLDSLQRRGRCRLAGGLDLANGASMPPAAGPRFAQAGRLGSAPS